MINCTFFLWIVAFGMYGQNVVWKNVLWCFGMCKMIMQEQQERAHTHTDIISRKKQPNVFLQASKCAHKLLWFINACWGACCLLVATIIHDWTATETYSLPLLRSHLLGGTLHAVDYWWLADRCWWFGWWLAMVNDGYLVVGGDG